MVDKFPEAFDRYVKNREPVKEEGIKTFPELVTSFGRWQGRTTTRLQRKAMSKISDNRIGIKPYIEIRYTRTYKSGKVSQQTRYRDLKSGQFIKSSVFFEEA